ncbi:hypothetical protein SAMN02746066_02201 [Anaerosporobacter mobilis DSM 15930]|uniref:Cellobiose phosphorylase n=1 Tax=Anaerosporobacter mobilis DSM 15930 TaxID=1120996 RepID=A0A1M7JD81_9FIRM|nr:hypothetical protein [Anaerosporobacter mobilis]SHM50955.1 hypothetical protein SAMN02746066_02201 [Anaerosporobacter mobilis DSM 15930]
MLGHSILDENKRYRIDNYGKKTTFASFLPGISGRNGIPIWCYYVNRGQGVTSFGVDCKDQAIMEFFPAHQAYQNVKTQGFRTFIKKNGCYFEPFKADYQNTTMAIGMNELEVNHYDESHQIETSVTYYTLPGEKVGALVRKVSIKNVSDEECMIEVLDGMPAVIPYGVNMGSMKEMGQTTKAWMQVEDVDTKTPYFRVRVSMEDTASVQGVEGGNFAHAINDLGEELVTIVDPAVVFDYDTGLDAAVGLLSGSIDELTKKKQVTQNNLPCCFFAEKRTVKAGEEICLYELFGQVENKAILSTCKEKWFQPQFYVEKQLEGNALIDEICNSIETKTGNELFDEYCKQTYLDNVLRGGYPIELAKNKIFYLYSRKHGDIERDYNYFRMLPEYYSQGNGNFRDVNQNRREDVRFQPYVKEANIRTFYNMIQIDGYNPLSVEKVSYTLEGQQVEKIIRIVPEASRLKLLKLLGSKFTPGQLFMTLEDCNWKDEVQEKEFVEMVLQQANGETSGSFGEGYWSDHWTYNLDLVEEYLHIYPENEKELLFEDSSYTYFETRVTLLPRKKRYVKTDNGIRQYNFLDKARKKDCENDKLRSAYGKGEVVTGNLMEKILLLSTLKYATLDPYGMGIEMEGGKPGWYDALNGLPGIFGSSMAETYELARMLKFAIEKLSSYRQSVIVFSELAELMEALEGITNQLVAKFDENTQEASNQQLDFWNASNDYKELYREKTVFGVSGEKRALSNGYLVNLLEKWLSVVERGIKKAIEYGDGLCPTYFSYKVTKYSEEADMVIPEKFEVERMPYFLEGPVRYMKIVNEDDEKKSLYRKVKESNLYDRKLSMYKVNTSLQEASYEIGRCKAFTPGWLENESIWLHMEYKYLLELLKAGLYSEFFEDFHNACVPFLDYEMYGRSVLENSSFLASSANPNEAIHGKGFVARLSGSTAEFLNMWQIMMFGETPFILRDGELIMQLLPVIPSYLLSEECKVEAMLFGKTKVCYNVEDKMDVIPGRYNVQTVLVEWNDGTKTSFEEGVITGDSAIRIRNGEAVEIKCMIGGIK